jgi:DNA-directed RNA polymerase subunit M/transcription elongation factor TFIIS
MLIVALMSSKQLEYCPTCDNVLLVRKKKTKVASSKKKKSEEEVAQKFLYCPSCGYEVEFKDEVHKDRYTLSVKLDHSHKDKTRILQAPKEDLKVTDEEREANEDLFQDIEQE